MLLGCTKQTQPLTSTHAGWGKLLTGVKSPSQELTPPSRAPPWDSAAPQEQQQCDSYKKCWLLHYSLPEIPSTGLRQNSCPPTAASLSREKSGASPPGPSTHFSAGPLLNPAGSLVDSANNQAFVLGPVCRQPPLNHRLQSRPQTNRRAGRILRKQACVQHVGLVRGSRTNRACRRAVRDTFRIPHPLLTHPQPNRGQARLLTEAPQRKGPARPSSPTPASARLERWSSGIPF